MNFTLEIPKPFNFEGTLKSHGWFQLPPFYWDSEQHVLNWVMCLRDRISLVCIASADETDKTSRIRLSGEFEEDVKEEIEQKFRYVFNLDLDLADYYQLCANDESLVKVPERGIGRLMRAESLWEDLFKSICGTNVQWKQAVKMIHNIATIGDAVADTDFHRFPTAEQILSAGDPFLKETGRVGYRSPYLLDLAERFVAGEAKATHVEGGKLAAGEMKTYFLGFKGIGPTTARYLMALYGHYEEMAIDSLVVNYMKQHHFNGVTPTPQQIVNHYARFGRWSYLAYWMEFIVNEGWSPDA
ncbi:hypothetical protein JXA70_04995 [candidate division KSB1 bacterium]|nr:hypothetical protein [candidate division KSB1 bacterium]